MDVEKLISEAKLNLFGMSGSGLGAVLLALVALAVVLRTRRGESMQTLLKALPWLRKRSD
ncbi:hypothetical protein [Tateyamaria sp. SN6-1]|uniref:hypothetical protein n=1 Tax=Tateyamaria sp. SN6-1 TaxID=3092148 RepID=UPI0039F513F6